MVHHQYGKAAMLMCIPKLNQQCVQLSPKHVSAGNDMASIACCCCFVIRSDDIEKRLQIKCPPTKARDTLLEGAPQGFLPASV